MANTKNTLVDLIPDRCVLNVTLCDMSVVYSRVPPLNWTLRYIT